ncbi:hypothetical protein TSAR_006692 [Trichomalopsis sarcophagae]|uniref:Uncharacterized protein n=1 Tax=Trichomalopsis sarcophagae TaxID=543379 RepID=A0A232FGN3_9HYME|nr:hypothetical protein TSAR_006692 [Trichomalopsis sarcophagae]
MYSVQFSSIHGVSKIGIRNKLRQYRPCLKMSQTEGSLLRVVLMKNHLNFVAECKRIMEEQRQKKLQEMYSDSSSDSENNSSSYDSHNSSSSSDSSTDES